MSVTIPNLRDETISQARAEAQHLLAQAKETTISLNVSGAESGQIGDALNQVISQVCMLWLKDSTSTFRPSRTI